MSMEVAQRFIEAVARGDFAAAQECLHPDVATETPRGTVRGALAARQVLVEKAAGGPDHVEVERAEPQFVEINGEILVRTHELGRWRESGEVAYERDFAVRLTLDDERIVRIVVMPGGALPPSINSGSRAD
jgi:ketosteroid isomerase-like protein